MKNIITWTRTDLDMIAHTRVIEEKHLRNFKGWSHLELKTQGMQDVNCDSYQE